MNKIGDMICTLPLLRTLRKEYPAAGLTVLADASNHEMLEAAPFVDNVLVFRKSSGLMANRYLTVMRALSGYSFDLVIAVKGGFSSFLAIAALLSGARCRVGYVSAERPLVSRLYTLPVAPIDFSAFHQVEACLHLAAVLGVQEMIRDISLEIPSAYRQHAIESLHNKHLKPRERLVLMNVSNNRVTSTWPADKFIELGRLAGKRYGAKCIVTGIDADAEQIGRICAAIGDMAHYIKCGKALDFAALAANCNLLVAGDGGASHMGAAVGSRVISLFGATSPVIWSPYGEQHCVLQRPDGDARNITVEEVAAVIEAGGVFA
ncbi:MAG TPA: glycosyltransferase family 9 protein [Dissulfurispiraceae bacterium]|nr:glycosyltransferase family 9 protein [Dissulfurispiraceae bacterium]